MLVQASIARHGSGAYLRIEPKAVDEDVRRQVRERDITEWHEGRGRGRVGSGEQVERLGKFPLPVEVIPFAQSLIKSQIEALGAEVKLRLCAYNPYVTDGGHHVLDCTFGEISDLPALADKLRVRKVGNIEKLKPDVIAAGNMGCIAQIAAGTAIPVVHTVELIDWATGGPKPERLKELKEEKGIPAAAAEPVAAAM